MLTLPLRMRRNRKLDALRKLLAETHLKKADLIAPLFVTEENSGSRPISSIPGISCYSIDTLTPVAKALHKDGIQAVILFPIIHKKYKDEQGSRAYQVDGIIPKALKLLKKEIPSLCLISDIALDPYTTHGHDGLVGASLEILNDPTVAILGKIAICHAEAGADLVAPSDMMDGRIGYIRKQLDLNGFTNTGILAYSIKYASCFYSPFRAALQSHPAFGNKKTYQMDPANAQEAILEAELDEKEGADILMVKPASNYLDIIAKLKNHTTRPICAYQVSGEYGMILAAHEKGLFDADDALYESLLSIKRAGADIIITYAAKRMLSLLDS